MKYHYFLLITITDNDVVFVTNVKIFVDIPERFILWHTFDDKHMYRPKDSVCISSNSLCYWKLTIY